MYNYHTGKTGKTGPAREKSKRSGRGCGRTRKDGSKPAKDRKDDLKKENSTMKKDLGLVQAVYPMPVLMVAAYDENEKVNVMNVAWGQICDMDKIILFIGEGKRTWLNIKESGAFTVALADREHMDAADFFGIASGNKIDDKFERTGYHAVKSDKVHAPVIEEFPVVMECELLEFLHTDYVDGIVGKIVNVKAEEAVLGENGKVDPEKLNALMFDQFQNGYYVTGEKVGKAWNAGAALMKK